MVEIDLLYQYVLCSPMVNVSHVSDTSLPDAHTDVRPAGDTVPNTERIRTVPPTQLCTVRMHNVNTYVRSEAYRKISL